MIKMQIIGNLGADAQVYSENGSKFVKLSIADTVHRKKADGTTEEKTTWVSATINGDGGELLQYLKKGTKVYASGDARVKTFHSEKQRALVAGIDLFIRDIQLISVNRDDVPRDLYDIEGNAHAISKWFYSAEVRNQPLYSRNGEEFIVDPNGWVRPVQQVNGETTDNESKDSDTESASESQNSETESASESQNSKTESASESQTSEKDSSTETSSSKGTKSTDNKTKK